MKNLLKEKIALEEPVEVLTEADENTASDEPNKDLPDAIPEKPIVVPTEPEIDPKLEIDAISGLLTSELTSVYSNIDSLKSIVATIAAEFPDRQDIIDILNEITDERTMHIGMLQQALELVDGKHKDLVDAGEEKGTAVAGEQEANDLEDKGE